MNIVHSALQIKGESMLPDLREDDIVVVQKNFAPHDDDIVIISINGDKATCKQLFKREEGIIVQGFNPSVFPA